MELVSLTILLHKLLKRRDIQSTNTFVRIGKGLSVKGPLLAINLSDKIVDEGFGLSNLVTKIQEIAAAAKI